MVHEVVYYCFGTLNALVTNRTYGNAVTVDGMCISLTVPLMVMMRVLTVTDVRHAVIDIELEI
jgi:hypothetical protein